MNRCYVEPELFRSGCFRIEGDDAGHLLRVLRVRTGEVLEIFDGRGRSVEAVVTETGRHFLIAEADASRPPNVEPPPACRVTLIPAVIRPGRMDWMIEKGVELGMQALWPFSAGRSRPHKAGAEDSRRARRVRRIAIEAARQSGRCHLPEIAPEARLEAVLARAAGLDVLLAASLAPGARPMAGVLMELEAPPRSLGILVGPEGDLTPEEQARVLAAGAIPVRLGRHVLRSETAALCALSLVRGVLEAEG